MKKFIISSSAGFVINNVVATLVAMLILNPFLNPSFEGTVRSQEQGLQMPSLLGGYLLLTILMAWLYPRINWSRGWVNNGLTYGLVIGGIIFVAGHLIVAGWSIIPGQPMLISGLIDTLATIATGLFIAYIYRNNSTTLDSKQ